MKPLTWSSTRIKPGMWNLSRLSNVSGFIPLGKILETPVMKLLTWSSTRVNLRVPQRSGLLSAARLWRPEYRDFLAPLPC